MSIPGVKEFRAQQFTVALPLLLKSAQQGYPEAQCMLGNLYQLGIGDTEVDETTAIYWYYQAARQGYSTATGNLAGMVWSNLSRSGISATSASSAAAHSSSSPSQLA